MLLGSEKLRLGFFRYKFIWCNVRGGLPALQPRISLKPQVPINTPSRNSLREVAVAYSTTMSYFDCRFSPLSIFRIIQVTLVILIIARSINSVNAVHGNRAIWKAGLRTSSAFGSGLFEVDSINEQGNGVADIDGKKIILRGALPGEIVEGEMFRWKHNKDGILTSAIGRSRNIITRSLHRVEPKCGITDKCGGCQLQHLQYEEQLLHKKRTIDKCLASYQNTRGLTVDGAVKPASSRFNYRNRAQFAIQHHPGDKIKIGLYESFTHDVVDTEDCPVQHPLVGKILCIVQDYFGKKQHQLSVYDDATGKGALRHLLIRTTFATNEAMVCIVAAEPYAEIACISELVELISSLQEVKSILFNMNDDPGDNILSGNAEEVLYGRHQINEIIAGVKISISARSFVQSNPVQAAVLYELAAQMGGLTKGVGRVWDLYCGVGTIGLFLAPMVDNVIGIEDCLPAVEDARRNQKLNCIKNVYFMCGKVEDLLTRRCSDISASKGSPNELLVNTAVAQHTIVPQLSINDTLVLNPPRMGCNKGLLDHISGCKVKKLVYISCNPHTLARDLDIMVGHGYSIKAVQAIDMFPQTYHVETITVLEWLD